MAVAAIMIVMIAVGMIVMMVVMMLSSSATAGTSARLSNRLPSACHTSQNPMPVIRR